MPDQSTAVQIMHVALKTMIGTEPERHAKPRPMKVPKKQTSIMAHSPLFEYSNLQVSFIAEPDCIGQALKVAPFRPEP